MGHIGHAQVIATIESSEVIGSGYTRKWKMASSSRGGHAAAVDD